MLKDLLHSKVLQITGTAGLALWAAEGTFTYWGQVQHWSLDSYGWIAELADSVSDISAAIIAGLLVLVACLSLRVWLLEREKKPNFSVRFERERRGIADACFPGNNPAKFVRVNIDAKSNRKINACTAYLTEVKGKASGETAFSDIGFNQRLWLRSQEPFGVAVGVTERVDVMTCDKAGNKPFVQSGMNYFITPLSPCPVTYRFKIVVEGDGISVPIEIDVIWNGQWDTITAHEVRTGGVIGLFRRGYRSFWQRRVRPAVGEPVT